MACWSAEKATKAYLRALKMGKRGKEPDVAEFISTLAAGNNARLMVMVSATTDIGSNALSLVAAAHHTGGKVVCILPELSSSCTSKTAVGPYADGVKLLTGDARTLLLNDYRGADFVLMDCNIDDHKAVFKAAQECAGHGGGLIVGYNSSHNGSWCNSDSETHFLPIGEGLLVTRVVAGSGKDGSGSGGGHRKRSRWVVRVDKCTGEKRVYGVTSAQQETEV